MSDINTHREIYLFLQGESEIGLEIITNIFYKQINSSSFLTLKEQHEDLFMEFMVKLFSKRDFLLKKFQNQEDGLSSYIREMIKNFLRDKIISMSRNPLDNVNIIEGEFESNHEIPVMTMNKIEAIKLKETLEETISEKEFILLCYMVIDNREEKKRVRELFFKDLSNDALYQRVKRLKEKLSKIVKEKNFAQGSVLFFLENILPSICKRVKNERD